MSDDIDINLLFGPEHLMEHAPADISLIAWAEESVGVRLPEAYKQMVRVRNGGQLFLNGIMSKEQQFSWHDPRRVYEICDIKGISKSSPMECITELTRLAIEEWEGPEGLVVLTGEGHWWLCLDYRTCGPDGEPTVVHSENGSESTSGDCEEFVVADSFLDLLKGLRLDYGGDYILGVRGLDRKTIEKRVMKLKTKPNTQAHKNFMSQQFPNFRSPFGRMAADIKIGEGQSFDDEATKMYKRNLLDLEANEIAIPVCVHFEEAESLIKQILEVIGPEARVLHSPMDGPQII